MRLGAGGVLLSCDRSAQRGALVGTTFEQRPGRSDSDTWGHVAEEFSRQALSQEIGLGLRQAVGSRSLHIAKPQLSSLGSGDNDRCESP